MGITYADLGRHKNIRHGSSGMTLEDVQLTGCFNNERGEGMFKCYVGADPVPRIYLDREWYVFTARKRTREQFAALELGQQFLVNGYAQSKRVKVTSSDYVLIGDAYVFPASLLVEGTDLIPL